MENFEFITLFLLTTLFIYAIISSCALIYLFIWVKSSEKSTHQVEYVPMDPKWASTDEEIAEINEKSEMAIPDLDENDRDFNDIDLKTMI